MAKFDPKLTEAMKAWLSSDHSDEKNIIHGAEMLLSANRNQGLFIRITRNPEKFLSKLEYEIRKQLNIRNEVDGMDQVEKLEKEILPDMQAAVEAAASKPDAIPAIHVEDGNGFIVARGMRPDHDRLPENIKALWEGNAERWNKMKAIFELLKTLDQPCDRFEYVKQLKEAWYKYRQDMNTYDDYVLNGGGNDNAPAEEPGKPTEEQQKEINNAQAYISKFLPVLLNMVEEAKDPEFKEMEQLETMRGRVQERVNTLVTLGVELSEERKQQLRTADITFGEAAEEPEAAAAEETAEEKTDAAEQPEPAPAAEETENSSEENAEGEGSE